MRIVALFASGWYNAVELRGKRPEIEENFSSNKVTRKSNPAAKNAGIQVGAR
jgi:hypothetical protein